MPETVLEYKKLEGNSEPAPEYKEETVKRHRVSKRFRLGRTIAVNINDRNLEFATVNNYGITRKLYDVYQKEIPDFQETEETLSFISYEIDQYIKKFGHRFTRYIIGIGGNEAAFRTVTLPHMSSKEMANAIYWEAKKRIPFDINDSDYGFHEIETIQTGDNKSTSLSIMAVPGLEIEKRLKTIKAYESNFGEINCDIEALGFLLPDISNFDEKKSYALINIKHDYTLIAFYRGARLEFMHVSSIGYKGVNIDQVAESKYQPFIEALINEIQNSLDFYVGQFSASTADDVYVYGDLCYSSDLLLTLSERFGISFRCFPLEYFLKKQPRSRKFAEAIPHNLGTIALAMADYKLINFLPSAIREKINIKRIIRLAIPGLVTLALILSGFWYYFSYKNDIIMGQIDSLDQQIVRIETMPTFLMYNKIKSQLVAEQAILNNINYRPTRLELNLKTLSHLTPHQVTLQQYDLKFTGNRYHLTILGRVSSNDPPPEVVLAEFVARLEDSPFYEKVTIKNHIKKFKESAFNIEFQIKADALL